MLGLTWWTLLEHSPICLNFIFAAREFLVFLFQQYFNGTSFTAFKVQIFDKNALRT